MWGQFVVYNAVNYDQNPFIKVSRRPRFMKEKKEKEKKKDSSREHAFLESRYFFTFFLLFLLFLLSYCSSCLVPAFPPLPSYLNHIF